MNTRNPIYPKPSSTCLCPKKSMDEVWKSISFSSLHNRRRRPATAAAAHDHSLNLQDFLACASTKTGSDSGRTAAAGPCAPPPATELSLITSSHDDDGGCGRPYFASCLDDLSASGDLFRSFCKKRVSENDDNSGNWRHKRMMKNRASAARSRARKQAYATGLEMEVKRLMDENAKLKRQLEKFKAAEAADGLPKNNTLHRTLTAPF